jgi:chorismate mutase
LHEQLSVGFMNNAFFTTENKLFIAGPCSAESPEQVLQTAQQLQQTGKVNYLRAGIWKPRTRPNAFEGIGKDALLWLVEAGKQTGLKTCTEVATTEHVEQALKAGVDLLWVGARTSTNPFSVQAIADALKGVEINILVKNPINPDLGLWIGALERLNNSGSVKLGAIHRGFSTYHKQYRNAPMWEIPLELKTTFPELPLLCDPSHIAGNRTNLFEVAQKAMNLDMDGLMIETHIDPDKALSDAQQQIKPTVFDELINNLTIKSASSDSKTYNLKLEELRSKIDYLDAEWINALSQRMQITQKIGQYKKENGVTIFQLERWKEIMETRKPLGIQSGLSASFMDQLLETIHQESIKVQNKLDKK